MSSEAKRPGPSLDRLSPHLSSLDTFGITGFVETNPQQLRVSQRLLTPTGRTGGFIMMGIRNALRDETETCLERWQRATRPTTFVFFLNKGFTELKNKDSPFFFLFSEHVHFLHAVLGIVPM